IPSLCSGGTPETSHSSTRLSVSLSKHMAKFRIPTSILRIINLKDLYIFNLKLSRVTQSRSSTFTEIGSGRLSSWRKTKDNHNENEKASADDARNHGILDWTSETFKEGSDNVGDTLVFRCLGS